MKTNPQYFNYLPIIFCIFIFASCSTYRSIDKKFEKEKTFENGFSGLAIFDLKKNKMIYERNSGKYFTPASNTKLFTFYTGLKILGDSVPGLKYMLRNDSLYFSGTGDPSFLYSELPESGIFDFLKEKEETLVYVTPKVEEFIFGPGWAWDDYSSYYSVERTAFPIYGNRVNFKFYSEEKNLKVIPKIFKDSVSSENVTEEISGVERELNRNRFLYSAQLYNENSERNVPFKYSPELLAQMLSDTLGKQVNFIRTTPIGFENAKTLYSIPVDSMYKTMLQVSDNFIAEQILLLAANEISDTLQSKIAIDYMQKNYLKSLPNEIKWEDGSGLSRYNLFTPGSTVGLLKLIYREVSRERLFNLLAVGGVSGTLKNNYRGSPPYIFAKTGTLRNNHSLSGYLRAKSGTILAFSFMNSNYVVPTSEIKKQMEEILREFYEEN